MRIYVWYEIETDKLYVSKCHRLRLCAARCSGLSDVSSLLCVSCSIRAVERLVDFTASDLQSQRAWCLDKTGTPFVPVLVCHSYC
jgi:hypothetical protein